MLDHCLDEAVLAGISPVRIVHGKGTGALRKATREALSRDRRVRSFRQGADGEGGDGVTAVSYTHLRAHETVLDIVCRILPEKKKFYPPLHSSS